MQKKYKDLAGNTLLLTCSQFGSKMLAFFLVPLYSEVLSTSEYGVADAVSTTVHLLLYICSLQIGASVMRFSIIDNRIAKHTLRFGERVLLIGGIPIIVGLIIVKVFKIIQVDDCALFFVIALYLTDGMETILNQYVRGVDKVKVMAISSFISTLCRLVLAILSLLVFKWGLFGYFFSLTVGSIPAMIFTAYNIRCVSTKEISFSEKKKLHKEMISYAIPFSISQLAWWVNNSIDRYIIIWLKGTSLNGIYSMSYKVPSIMAMICNIFSQAWGISAIKEFDNEDHDGFFGRIYALYNSGLCIVCSVIILFNDIISKILFHKEFYEAWRYASCLIFAMVFSGLASFFSGIFGAVKKNKILAVSTVIAAAINVILNILLIPFLGAFGAAIATVLSFYACWLIRFIEAKKIVNFKTNVIRDHVAYLLIVCQIVFEHFDNHFYIGQITLTLLIILVFFREFKDYLIKVGNVFFKKK